MKRALGLLTLILVLVGGGVGAAPGGPTSPTAWLTPRPLLGDLVRFNRPLAIGVPVSNDSSKAEPCRVILSESRGNSGQTGEARLNLAPGSRHIVPVMVPRASYWQSVAVEQPSRSLQPTTVQVNGISETDILALVLSPVGTEFSYLGGYKALVRSGEFRVNHAPMGVPLPTSFWPYLASDLIIIYDLPRLNLSSQVEEAVVQWTRLGGTLVLVSPEPQAEYRGTPFEPLVPSPGNWQPLLSVSHGAKPMAWARPVDQGQTILVTTPVIDQKVLGNDETLDLWNLIVNDLRNNCPFARSRFEAAKRLATPAELPKPSAAGIAWYLVIYVLVVIPLNYWWLRRRDRMLWLIVTVPAISTLIAGLSFVLNSLRHSSDTVLRELGVACLSNHADLAITDHSLMLFSPRSLRYKIDFAPGSLLGPAEMDYSRRESHLVNEGTGGYYRDFTIPMWSLARFRNTGIRPLEGALDVEIGSQNGRTRHLTVTNKTGFTLTTCCYHDQEGKQVSQFFDVGPGTNSIQAQMHPGNAGDSLCRQIPGLADKDWEILMNERRELMQSGLVGWSQDPRLASGVKIDRACRHYPLTMVLVATAPRPLPPPPPKVVPPAKGAKP